MPKATLFGYFIEWGEMLAGLGLVTAGLVALLRPLAVRSLRGTSATLFVYGDRLLERLAPLAATGTGLLSLSYFFLDGLPKPWFVPSIAFGGSIDTGLFFAAASVVLVMSQFVQRHPSRLGMCRRANHGQVIRAELPGRLSAAIFCVQFASIR